VLDIHHAVA
jgi:hypothetical protein